MMRLIQLFLSTTALLAAVLFLPDQFSSSHRMTPGLYARVKQIQKRVHNAPNDWFMRQRTWPGTELNRAAVAQAREQALNLRRGARSLDEPWVFAGPSNVGGRITALAVHPSEPNVVYAGAALGGVFKSTDGGLNYVPVFEEDFALSTGALAMDPSNAQRVWVGTGEANSSGDSYGGNGVYLSEDGGQTWQHKGLEATRHIGRIVVDPTDANRVYVAAMGELFGTNPERGLYRTNDGGNTWSRVLFVTDSTGCVDVALHPTNPDTVYAVMWERIRRPYLRMSGGITSRIWRSYDGGDTWTVLAGGLPVGTTTGRGGITISPANPNRLYAIFANHPGNLLGIYRSDNGGTTWTQVSNPGGTFYSNFGWYFGQITADPANQDIVYIQGVNMYRSTNAGASWTNTFGAAHVDHHAFWINPSNTAHVITGHDGGVHTSTNFGFSATSFDNLPITQFYAITSDPTLPSRLYGGTQDNSTPRTSTGATNDWDVLYFGDGFYCLVDPRDSDVIYAEYQYGGLGKSLDGGFSWNSIWTDFASDRINWSMPYVMAPQNPDVLYAGTHRVLRTVNGGANWTGLSGDLSYGPGPGNLTYGTITTIDVSPADSNVIYCGTDDSRVWVSLDYGNSWSDISTALPNRWCTRVAPHPDSANVVYVSFSGYKELDYLPHLFRSDDNGAMWTDVGQGLPEAPVNDVIVDPLNSDYLHVATDFGVYYTADIGEHWAVLGESLPLSSVFDLQLTSDRYLVAGTHGRSMWKYGLGGAPVSAPQALVIGIVSGTAVLNWQPSAGATQYHIYGSTTPNAPGTLLATVVAATWTDPDFTARPDVFFYYVTAE